MTYKRLTGLDQTQFCDEMFDACRHFINWDFERVWKETRLYANRHTCKLIDETSGWHKVAPENCPENYGYNAIPFPKRGKRLRWNSEEKGMEKNIISSMWRKPVGDTDLWE